MEEARAVAAAGMTYINVPMNGVVAPKNEQIAKIVAVLSSNEPVFVHCKRDVDRTGRSSRVTVSRTTTGNASKRCKRPSLSVWVGPRWA